MNKPTWLNLNQEQQRKIATICADIGIVTLAAMVLPALLDRFDLTQFIIGLVLSFILWAYTIWFLREKSL